MECDNVAQNSYWRWRCTIMGKKPWVIIHAKIWSKEMAKFLPNEKHQHKFQKSSEMVAPFGCFVRFNEGHKFEPPKTNPPSIWQLEHRNAFGFWDGGDDDGCCLVPTCSFFNHSCEPNCLHRMEYGEVRLDSMLFVTLRQMKNSLFLIWIRRKWGMSDEFAAVFFFNTTSSS